MAESTDLHPHSLEAIDAWKAQATAGILRALLWVGGVAVAASAVSSYRQGDWLITGVLVAIYLAALGALTTWGSASTRAGLLVGVAYVGGAVQLLRDAPHGAGMQLLLVTVFLAGLFFDRMAARLVCAAVVGTVFVLFGLYGVRILPSNDPAVGNIAWALAWSVSFALLALTVLLPLESAKGRLRRSIVESRQSLAALIESEEKLRAIFNSVDHAVFIHDLECGRMIEANERARAMFKFKAAELERLTIGDFSSGQAPYDDAAAGEWMAKAALGERCSFEWLSRDLQGRQFWVEVNLHRVRIGEHDRVVATVRDIDRRKRAEQMLLESEKLRTVAGLAAGMAHEINNPLTGVIQGSEAMLNRLSKDSPANQEAAVRHGLALQAVRGFLDDRGILRLLGLVHDSGTRAARLVRSMLAFSRSRAPATAADPRLLVDRSLDLLSKSAAGIDIDRLYSPQTPAVPCDESQIQQVLVNLIVNALQAMGANPPDRPPRLVLRTGQRDGSAVIEVQDNGPGIPADLRRRIFEPFFTTKPVGEGTGLGLFVSHHIVSVNHHGTLACESAEEGGTVFTVCLPIGTGGPA